MGNSYGGISSVIAEFCVRDISSVIAEFCVRDSDPQGGEAFYAAPF